MCSVDFICTIVNLHPQVAPGNENACDLFVFELVLLVLFPWGSLEEVWGFEILGTLAISRLLLVQKTLVLCCSVNISLLVDFLFCKFKLSLWVSGHTAATRSRAWPSLFFHYITLLTLSVFIFSSLLLWRDKPRGMSFFMLWLGDTWESRKFEIRMFTIKGGPVRHSEYFTCSYLSTGFLSTVATELRKTLRRRSCSPIFLLV